MKILREIPLPPPAPPEERKEIVGETIKKVSYDFPKEKDRLLEKGGRIVGEAVWEEYEEASPFVRHTDGWRVRVSGWLIAVPVLKVVNEDEIRAAEEAIREWWRNLTPPQKEAVVALGNECPACGVKGEACPPGDRAWDSLCQEHSSLSFLAGEINPLWAASLIRKERKEEAG